MKIRIPFRRGIALVIVLVFLVLLSGVIIAFLSGVLTQRSFSRTAADAASTQQLADSAVSIVMSQIVDATGTSAGLSGDGTTLAWASQPGMIRTYDDTGLPRNFYKLYSSDAMSVQGSGFSITTDDPNNIPRGGWNSSANVGIYTDLNAPVLVTDTSGAIVISNSNSGVVSTGTYTAVYPIIDPFAENTLTATGTSNGVDGFSISSRPAYVNGSTVPASGLSPGADPTATVPGAGSTANPAPMPVKWLYVLSQGQIIPPDPTASSNGVIKFSGSYANIVSGSNPIVGRIAFWADDDTCKVNINTASEGVFWDTPRVFSLEDNGEFNSNSLNATSTIPGMAISQPVQKEYQRYPGHPATTCLSPIFGNLGLSGTSPWQPWLGTIGSPVGGVNLFNQYYAIAPRVSPGGSNAGTTLTGTDPYSGAIQESGTSSLIPDHDRLYASVDELMFTGSAVNTSGTTARVTNPNVSGTSIATLPTLITKKVLEKTRFFLTANSNAPEVTLFNTPRISMWPVWDSGPIMASGSIPIASGSTARTAFDNLAAFCGTIGGLRYYFTRANSRSPTQDYGLVDPVTGQPRNATLYRYLQTLTTKAIPGFGGNFSAKFGTDRDEILTLIYDYIRCINMADSTNNFPYTPLFQVQGTPADSTDPYRLDADVPNNPDGTGGLFPRGAGEVVPIQIQSSSGPTMGAGRFLTVSEADLLFYASSAVKSGSASMSAVFLLQFASPMEGLSQMRSSLQYSVTGLNQFNVTVPASTGSSVSLGLPSGGTNYIELSDAQTSGGRGIGGIEGFEEGLYSLGGGHSPGGAGWDVSVKQLSLAGGYKAYPFYSAVPITFKVNPLDQTFAFTGGTVTIALSTQDQPATVLQSIKVSFPNGVFKIPGVYNASVSGTNFNQRLTATTVGPTTVLAISGSSTASLITGSDTLIGIQPAGCGSSSGMDPTAGDIRMIAPLQNVPASRFAPQQNYFNTGVQFAHGMITASGNPYASGTYVQMGVRASNNAPQLAQCGLQGTLIPGPIYMGFNHNNGFAQGGGMVQDPYVPSRVGNAVQHANSSGGPNGPGDWDTGIGNCTDGAYMNKPDEGDTRLWVHNNTTGNSIATVLRYPYQLGDYEADTGTPGQAYFSPNKQVPSSMMLGSIPTGVQRDRPWQTLLFNPKPEDPNDPGHGTPVNTGNGPPYAPPYTVPPDYLMADLFWMPIVEPYAISQPLSTAGKINLNYQILPFDYINRKTGIYAVMKATKYLAIPTTDGTSYKPLGSDTAQDENVDVSTPQINANRRQTIDIGATLAACDARFANSDIYRSPTEISDINMIPSSLGYSGSLPAGTSVQNIMTQFWGNYAMTGNNVRDKPYVDIYPRLTTKSNSFTVHVWVQSLRQNPVNANAGRFIDPNGAGALVRDSIVSEYRGSTTIERYIDPNDPRLTNVDFATTPSASIDPYYKFRVVSVKRFSP